MPARQVALAAASQVLAGGVNAPEQEVWINNNTKTQAIFLTVDKVARGGALLGGPTPETDPTADATMYQMGATDPPLGPIYVPAGYALSGFGNAAPQTVSILTCHR